MTADEVKAAIDGMEANAREQWYPVFKSILVLLAKRLDTLEAEHGKTLTGAKRLAVRVKAIDDIFNQLRAKVQPPAPAEAEEAAVPAAPAAVGADGQPDQAVLEAQMDAAIAGTEAKPPAQAAPPVSKGKRQPPPLRTVPQSMPPTSPGGDAMTPEQAAIEAQMDAALKGG